MDLLRIFEALKVFIKDERDTGLGLIFFLLLGFLALKYILLDNLEMLAPYAPHLYIAVLGLIFVIWLHNRHVVVSDEKFTIAIAPLQILMLNLKQELSGEAKRNLKTELVDYIYSSLHFHKDKADIDKYIEIIRLPNRIKPTERNAHKWVKKIGAGLVIWGDAYYDGENLFFKPRFEFSREPTNVYYKKFKKKINNLERFKIELKGKFDDQDTELADMLHYITYLGMMFQGIDLTHSKNFMKAEECFEHSLKSMRKKAFNNLSLSDIYLATRFFHARNYHKWGKYLLHDNPNDKEAFHHFAEGADSFFKREVEMKALGDSNKESALEHSILYGIHLLLKRKDFKKAEKKLEQSKKLFGKGDTHLYLLYKGLTQRSSKKAINYFNRALKYSKDETLCYDEIADYFFAKGEYKESIKFFEKRLGKSNHQFYNPLLLEESAHEKLSQAYAKELNFAGALREKITAIINHGKNEKLDKNLSM